MPYADLLARLASVRALGVELGLGRMRQALDKLGDPQRRFPAVQIAGTNGKGSTAAMTEAVLRAAGLRTGLYTSPHLARFTERIRIAGQEVDGERLAALDSRVAETGVPLTYFEVATALAFLAMAEDGVDIAVLETGLGGRLDAVTTCAPVATAVTSIGIDHTGYLGTKLTDIAREKGGIVKAGVPCFVGRLPDEADAVIAGIAAAAGAPLARVGRDFVLPRSPVALGGAHQRSNAAIAVALARAAAESLGKPLDDAAIASGLASVQWPARLEAIADDVWLDCAHNVEAARALAAALPTMLRGRRVVLLMSIVDDKDAAGMFAALGRVTPAAVVVTRSSSSRALPIHTLMAAARPCFPGADVSGHDDPLEALAAARARASAGQKGMVVACGSIFLVGQLRAHLRGEPVDPVPTSDPIGAPGR
jgi:dihydrofolate synthase / folylpolyglutamate synthase